MKITPDQLDTMHTLHENATPGPWQATTSWPPNVTAPRNPEKGEHWLIADDMNGHDARLIAAAYAFVPQAIAHIRFTEASTEEALLILDDALTGDPTTETLLLAIDYAVQKLRPVAPPVHDAAALAQLAEKFPLDIPWLNNCSCDVAQGLPVCGDQCEKAPEPITVAELMQHSGRNPLKMAAPNPDVAKLFQLQSRALQVADILLSKRALKALSFEQRVELCDAAGVHFALLEAVLQQPGVQQSSLTAAKFSQLMEMAAQRFEVVAELLKGGEQV